MAPWSRGEPQRSASAFKLMAEVLVNQVLPFGLTMLGTWISTQFLIRAIHPQPDRASYKRLLKSLKVDAKSLRLSSHEHTLVPNVITTSELDITMSDVAGLEHIVQTLKNDIMLMKHIGPRANRSAFVAKKGILLYGPPGTGKTMIAMALARESGAVMINVVASTLFASYLGESNKITRAIFTLSHKLSRLGKVVIVFLDEVEAILGEMSRGGEHEVTKQVRTEFMQMWDGIVSLRGVTVVGATNQPDALSDAIWRRFSEHFEVPLPDLEGRQNILGKKLLAIANERVLNTGSLIPDGWLRDDYTTVVHAPAGSARGPDAVPPTAQELARALGLQHADVSSAMSTAMNPLRRVATLTEGFSGSDLWEMCKKCARRALIRAIVAPTATTSAAPGADRGTIMLQEQDLLHALLETRAAATTTRQNYSYLNAIRRSGRAQPTAAAPANGNASEAALDLPRVLAMTDATTLRALAEIKEMYERGTFPGSDS